MLIAGRVSFADEDLLSSNFFVDDYGPASDLSFASSDASTSDDLNLGPDQIFPIAGSIDPDEFDYPQANEMPIIWDEKSTMFSLNMDHSNCGPSDTGLPSRLRRRGDTCTLSPPVDPPVVFDLSDPNLKLQPICPIPQFPFYTIAVCSSGNPLDEWGPLNNVILYDSVQGKF